MGPTPGDTDAGDRPSWRRGATGRLIGLLVLVVIAGGVGDTASPVLVTHAPLVLVALNPRARNVLLASRTVGVMPLLTVALIRRLGSVPVMYRLARLAVLLAVGVALASPLTWLLGFIADHQLSLLMLSIAVTTVYAVRYGRRLRRPRAAASVELVGHLADPAADDARPAAEDAVT